MRILVLGCDGYIGFPLALHLLQKGHSVYSLDSYVRRERVLSIGSDSLTPIATKMDRDHILKEWGMKEPIARVHLGASTVPEIVENVLREFQPDCVVHLAEQPSAPFSQMGVRMASITQSDNVIGTLHLLWAMYQSCPKAHLVKLGTMGEYGTPECDIPEGEITKDCLAKHRDMYGIAPCPMSGLLFPRTPGSFYHASKVMDTINIEFACRNWGLNSTDIMQGVVFGLGPFTEEKLLTRFDYDEYFGTVINRFCVQALIGQPLTIYGYGQQKRGFLTLSDSIQCLTLAIENPAEEGEYRTLNQFENIYSINKLAVLVCRGANKLGIDCGIKNIPNPRNEAETHYYHPEHQKLFDLGYVPTVDIQGEITKLIEQLIPYKDRIIEKVIMPTTKWR
ncbi:MAG: NAD-dependent epimerase/dehydratase family protein [Gammaproteobacteria bacterium]|nr:NAD-dependent epimerase/dehydratase family protein [Gammaproteobacteria bacterium]